MPEIRKHWEKEGIYFDAIYTGFIASIEQLDYIKEIIDSRLKEDGLVFVDPAMADNGKLYPAFDEAFAKAFGQGNFRRRAWPEGEDPYCGAWQLGRTFRRGGTFDGIKGKRKKFFIKLRKTSQKQLTNN